LAGNAPYIRSGTQRARERKHRDKKNPDLPTDPAELELLMNSVERFRGQVPVRLLPTSELDRLRAEHASSTIGDAVMAHVEEEDEHQAAVATSSTSSRWKSAN